MQNDNLSSNSIFLLMYHILDILMVLEILKYKVHFVDQGPKCVKLIINKKEVIVFAKQILFFLDFYFRK
jgi:hypothetical protein